MYHRKRSRHTGHDETGSTLTLGPREVFCSIQITKLDEKDMLDPELPEPAFAAEETVGQQV